MRKRLVFVLTLIVMLCLACFILTGCGGCGKKEEHVHDYSSDFFKDENNHWYECACGEKQYVTSHNFNNGTVTASATCTEDGVRTYTCLTCGQTKTQSINKLGHTFTNEIDLGMVDNLPYTVKYCSTCDKLVSYKGDAVIEFDEDDTICELHHNYTLVEWGDPPTCTSSSIVHFECVICGYDLIKNYDALGHIKGNIYKENGNNTHHYSYCQRENCGQKYYIAHSFDYTNPVITSINGSLCNLRYHYTCSECGYVKTQDVTKHDMDDGVIIQNATCTENGVMKYSCKNCSYYENEDIDPLGHNFGNYVLTGTNPNDPCEHLGTCTRCDATDKKTIHDFGEWVSTNNPNVPCEYKRECSRCHEYYVAIRHEYGNWIVDKSPTCTESGVRHRICSVCSDVETETIHALGHLSYTVVKLQPTCTEDGYYNSYCSRCGVYLGGGVIQKLGHNFETNLKDDYTANATQHWHDCTRCNYECCRDEHSFELKYYVEETVVDGTTSYKHVFYEECTVCGYGGMEGYKKVVGQIIHPHHNDVIIDPVLPTCTEPGYGPGVKCLTCNEYIFEPAVLSALGHNFVDSVCTRCGECEIALTLSTDGTYYIVSGIGAFTGTDLKIPATYKNKPIKEIAKDAFYNYDGLTSVTIGNSVTSIGYRAFSYCSSLTSVTIGDSVESIGTYAFYNCSSLTSVTIPDSVTSIGSSAFYGCNSALYTTENNLKYVKANDNPYCILIGVTNSNLSTYQINTETKYIAGSAFSWCRSLTSIEIPNSVTSIGYGAFSGCPIENATIPTIAISSIRNSNLKTVVITGGESIGDYAFRYCSSLTSVIIGDSVTSIYSQAFSNCSSLTNVTIGDGVKSIGSYAFSWCSSLTSVIIGDNVTSIGSSAFAYCSSLTEVTIPNSVTSIGDSAFYGCSSLISIEIPNSVTSIGNSAFSGCDSLTSVTIPDSVTSIGCAAFAYCSGLESITIPFIGASLNDANNYHFGYIFGAGDYGSNERRVPTSLKTVVITGGESIGPKAFYRCTSLTSITIPDSVTHIGDDAFSGCENLQYNIEGDLKYLGNEDNPYIYLAGTTSTDITTATINNNCRFIGEEAFRNCSSLTNIELPNSVTSIGASAFRSCSSLTSVNYTGTIDDWVQIDFDDGSANPVSYATKLYINNELVTTANISTATKINAYAFYNYTSLTSVTIGDSVTSIGSRAFYGCSSLRKISYTGTIDEWVQIDFDYYANPLSNGAKLYINNELVTTANITTATKINAYAFYNYTSLTSVTIGDGVTNISGSAFYNCSRLTEVYYNGTAEDWAKISIDSNNSYLINATRYYYSETEPTTTGNYWHYVNGVVTKW